MNYAIPISLVILPPITSDAIAATPISATIANRAVINKVTGIDTAPETVTGKRLKVVWIEPDSTEHDLGTVAGFSGGTSFTGTHGSITLAWPDYKNPRTTGDWWNILIPDDDAKINVYLVVQTPSGEVEIPLISGVPSPDGISELYSSKREVLEIRIEDVTGVASRNSNQTTPDGCTSQPAPDMPDIPTVVTYPVEPADSCSPAYPNQLLAKDEELITQQEKNNPLCGRKRVRYGDRDGRIVYRYAGNPRRGDAFFSNFPADEYDFEITEKKLLSGLRVEPDYIRFSISRINPYIDLASRLKISFPRAGLDEIVEVHEIGYRVMPSEERMTFKTRRQLTL